MTRRALLGGLGGLAGLAAVGASGAVGTASAGAATRTAPTASGTAGGIRLGLPRPTGPHPVGTVEWWLTDHGRADPWSEDTKRPRELMVSVWYPAHPGDGEGDGAARAPYMRAGAAAVFDAGAAKILKTEPGTVDWAGIGTHARTGAPPAATAGRMPVVLYSPGMYNERVLDTVAVTELASRGYAVVTVDHTYEAHAVEFPDGRVAEPSPALTGITSPVERSRAALDVRLADIRFVLDRLHALAGGAAPDAAGKALPRGLARSLDLSRTGMFGHSLGGMTTAEVMRLDGRVHAGANLDGPLGYDWSDPGQMLPVARTGLDRPFLQMGAWLRTETTEHPHTHEHSPSWKAMWEHSSGWRRDLWTERSEHNSFTDYQILLPALDDRLGLPSGLRDGMIGTVGAERFTRSRRVYLLAFFEQHLRGRHQPVLDGPSPRHPDVRFIR
ncbi:alpha/beta hydrolase [Streptomyces daliensis]